MSKILIGICRYLFSAQGLEDHIKVLFAKNVNLSLRISQSLSLINVPIKDQHKMNSGPVINLNKVMVFQQKSHVPGNSLRNTSTE